MDSSSMSKIALRIVVWRYLYCVQIVLLEVDADDYYKTYCFRVMLDYLQLRRNIFSLAQMAVKVLAFWRVYIIKNVKLKVPWNSLKTRTSIWSSCNFKRSVIVQEGIDSIELKETDSFKEVVSDSNDVLIEDKENLIMQQWILLWRIETINIEDTALKSTLM